MDPRALGRWRQGVGWNRERDWGTGHWKPGFLGGVKRRSFTLLHYGVKAICILVKVPCFLPAIACVIPSVNRSALMS